MIDRKTVMEKYDEVSRLETFDERRRFLGEQDEEMRAALWLENVARKTKGLELTTEQKEILEQIKKKYITVEFAQSVRGKSEEEADEEFQKTMKKATEIFGRDNIREWFAVLGDSGSLKSPC